MENNKNKQYNLSPEYLARLYNQEYMHHVPNGEKFRFLHGGLQRVVIEEALLATESMKLSNTFSEFTANNASEVFQKYAEYYAVKVGKDPRHYQEQESEFMRTHILKRERDTARGLIIADRARMIDSSHQKTTPVQFMARLSSLEK